MRKCKNAGWEGGRCFSMRTIVFTAVAMLVFLSPPASVNAASILVDETAFTGSRTIDGGGVTAGGDWTSAFTISWVITESAGVFTYNYTFASASPELSHWILQVSESIDEDNLDELIQNRNFGNAYEGPQDWDLSTSNPGFVGEFYGIKIDQGVNPTFGDTYTFTSVRVPIWGSFYAKGGNDDFAQNTGSVINPLGDGTPPGGTTDFTNWIPTPDSDTTTTTLVPTPGAAAGGIVGLLLMGLVRPRRKATTV